MPQECPLGMDETCCQSFPFPPSAETMRHTVDLNSHTLSHLSAFNTFYRQMRCWRYNIQGASVRSPLLKRTIVTAFHLFICGRPCHLSNFKQNYSGLPKYSPPLNFSKFCHVCNHKRNCTSRGLYMTDQHKVENNC